MFAINEVGISEASEETEYILIHKLTESQPPTVEKPLKNVVCGQNEDVELTCIFGGIPQPKVTWLKDEKKLKTAKATYVNRVATLMVSATENSEGMYKCIATNDHGEIETACTLEIQEKPVIAVPESEVNQKHRVGDEWSVTATVAGIPLPQIVWYKNGSRMQTSKDIEILTKGNVSTLKISKLERSHTSKYTVEAQNKAGTSTVDLSLRVFGEYPLVNQFLIMTTKCFRYAVFHNSHRNHWKMQVYTEALGFSNSLTQFRITNKMISSY